MKLLYLSCHSILEFDELSLLTEIDAVMPEERLGIEVFSMGAYDNPTQSGDYKRSVIPRGKFYQTLYGLSMQCDKDNIHPELIDWADIVIMMHNSSLPGQKEQQRWLVKNWQTIRDKNKKIVWRSIGQSVPSIEEELGRYRGLGLKILRYSPIEDQIPKYAGSDGLIRFAKDEDELCGWTGERKHVITIAQSFKKRGEHLGFALFDKLTADFPRKVYGTENEDLGEINGGEISYNELKKNLREARVFFYSGTQPAPYTLSFIEALMTGTPIVAIGETLHNTIPSFNWKHYEIPEIISSGVNGFIANSPQEAKDYIGLLMNDDDLARRISDAGRKTAIDLFGKKQRMREWADFLRRL